MKTIKPQKLGLLTRNFETNHRFYMGVSVLMYVPLCGPSDLLSEASLWEMVPGELGPEEILEAAIPKAKAEFLASGYAFPPGGKPSPACTVRIALGDREKTLNVFGDRHWKLGTISRPEPFEKMPLVWARAYGGQGFADNPLGRGFKAVAGKQGKIRMLPNLQYATDTLYDPDIGIKPAGFGPLDITRPQRFSKAGTYDKTWLKEDFPAFARDMDWTIFNIAPPDQWFDDHLNGDEAYCLENLHPEKPRIEGRLPGFRARCFVTRQTRSGEVFEELTTRFSTAWFFPHRERAVLIHQGLCESVDEDGSDIIHLMIGAERIGEPRSMEHYIDVLAKRLDKDKGMIYALKDSLLVPEDLPDSGIVLPADDNLIRKKMRQRAQRQIAEARAVAVSHGLDPDEHAPKPLPPEEPMPDLEHLPDFMAKLEAESEKQRKEAQKAMAESDRRMEVLFDSLDMDFDEIRKEYTEKPTGPPDFSAREKIDFMEDLAEKMRQQDQDPQEIEGYLKDEDFRKRLFDGEQQAKEGYRMFAHFQDPASPRQGEAAEHLRQMVVAAHAKGESLAGKDLTGIDLSGLDLQGVNFEKAFMESVNLTSTNLEGANLSHAVLAHANLTHARLAGANLSGANLGRADCVQLNAESADCRKAILARANLAGACFKGADLSGCDCSGARYQDTDFSGIQSDQLIFLECDLRGLNFSGARLDKSAFLKVDLSGVDFSGALMEACVFLEATGRQCRFTGANMTNARFVGQSVFDASNFSGTRLDDANLRGISLQGCDFSQARMDRTDFSGCNLRKANLYRAVGHEASFVKADLNDATLVSLNLMNGSLQRADIRGADLRGANLFQVDMARVQANPHTQLGDTFSRKVRIYPKRVAPHES
jgi:uncharacterized protein YjbI with pentapeptide repeats